MQTLNNPIYEINQESRYYIDKKWRKDQQVRVNDIIDEIASSVGFDANEFLYYGSYAFGFKEYTKGYEQFKPHLTKNSDRNGIHTFKKSSALFKQISASLKEVDAINKKVSPFELHDIFGINNLVASQWIGDRLFVEVKDKELTEKMLQKPNRREEYPIEPVKEIEYKDYLQLVLKEIQ